MARNVPVEVRIYALHASGNTTAYTALQLHALKPDGTATALTAPLFLPAGMVIDTTAEHSTLIASNPQAVTPDPADTRLDGATRVIRFLPDGAADLAAGSRWFLTVRAANSSDPAHFPSNWACIEVEPSTGRATLYRP